jgi:putative sterol carrier protein
MLPKTTLGTNVAVLVHKMHPNFTPWPCFEKVLGVQSRAGEMIMPKRNPTLATDSLFTDFAIPFKNFLGPNKSTIPTLESFKKMAELLNRGRTTSIVQITLINGGTAQMWCLTLSRSGCEVSNKVTDRPHLELITDNKTWSHLAAGKLSPLKAFGQGKLRVRGDITLAHTIAKKLQAG